MNRAAAYRLVTRTLEDLRAMSWEALHARVGQPEEDWEVVEDGERFVLFTWVQQLGSEAHALRIHAAAGSPSAGFTERVEESFRLDRSATS